MTATAAAIRKTLQELADPEIAAHSLRFFKSGPGDYGEGDRFIGIRMPVLRRVAKENRNLSLTQLQRLLRSAIHEERMCALLILVLQFQAAERAEDNGEQQKLFRFYSANTASINNWDLVDCSAYQIVGGWLYPRKRQPLYRWAESELLWERRIAMMATYYFIREHDFDDTLALAEILLHDNEDLIHKVCGWMLREVANRDIKVTRSFLQQHAASMPRTMLRYTIEKFPERERQRWLAV